MEISGGLRKSSDIFRSRIGSVEMKNLMQFTEKKVAGIDSSTDFGCILLWKFSSGCTIQPGSWHIKETNNSTFDKDSCFLWYAVCDAAAHKDCIPKASACRTSPGLHGQFSGTSPFRPHMAARNPFSKQSSSPIPPKLSPDLAKHRKVSAPARIRQGIFIPSFENRGYSWTLFKRPPSEKWEVAA